MNITHVIPTTGYRAVFNKLDADDLDNTPVTDIQAEVNNNLLVLPVLSFAIRNSAEEEHPHKNAKLCGLVIDPVYGRPQVCEDATFGNFMGYIPPEGGDQIMLTCRWIIAAMIDSRFIDEDTWNKAQEVTL